MKSKKKFKSELWAVPRWYGKRSLVIEVGPLNGGMSVEVYLHGNNICAVQRDANGYMNNWFISTCGWNSNVTNARLNAFVSRCIPPNGISIRIENRSTHWYFDGKDMGHLSTLNMSDYVAAIAAAERSAK